MTKQRRSAGLSGAGSLSGGEYARVTISGAGKVDGDLVAEELRISGVGKVCGSTEVTLLSVSGSGSFDGPIAADEMRVSGSAKVTGSIRAKEMKCSGTFRVSGGVSAEYMKLSGHLRVGNNVEAEIFRASGGFDIDGLLSADKIEIHLGGRCRARELGGERIRVEAGGVHDRGIVLDGLIRMFVGRGAVGLEAATIEGDDVHLEQTRADVVRGSVIEIGPGCRIGTVEYSDTLKIHGDAEVGRRTKV